MTALAHKIEQALQDIILRSENQLEILVGTCQSDVTLTNTQEHILMLIERQSLTNTEMAKELQVSQAAVTKAIKSLIAQDMLVAVKDGRDARVVRYSLTERAKPIAAEHEHHHAHTIASYEELLSEFSDQEKATIDRFLTGLVERISQ